MKRPLSVLGLTLLLGLRGKTIFIADSLVNFRPNDEELADIVVGAGNAEEVNKIMAFAKKMGIPQKVARDFNRADTKKRKK